ncbi:MAG: hypothetical protein OEX77_11120, partial [Candidatus Bathyarchaeota archaeon]|nr:hypothetical protein [Candidatus Bathyarchaeota archaeon]
STPNTILLFSDVNYVRALTKSGSLKPGGRSAILKFRFDKIASSFSITSLKLPTKFTEFKMVCFKSWNLMIFLPQHL